MNLADFVINQTTNGKSVVSKMRIEASERGVAQWDTGGQWYEGVANISFK